MHYFQLNFRFSKERCKCTQACGNIIYKKNLEEKAQEEDREINCLNMLLTEKSQKRIFPPEIISLSQNQR